MGIPINQALSVGWYIINQHVKGRKKYPVVLMLEPLFRCNLACAGCGKIDYPDKILNLRVSVNDALKAIEECGAPIVVLAGGEPLLHKELPQIVEGALEKKKFVTVCTNALLLDKKISHFMPHKRFNWSIHLDGDREMHDKSVCQSGVYDRAVDAIKLAKSKKFRVNINCTLFSDADPDKVVNFLNKVTDLGIDGITISPGYAYERAPDQKHFLNRSRTKDLFRNILKNRKGKRSWPIFQSALFLDFLAGNQTYKCTPWGNPTYTVFGWQKPCYLLGEGYAKTFQELMETTDWESYGTGNYEKCADCMVHSGFEPTAVIDAVSKPWKLAKVILGGINTEGPMAPEIPLHQQRPANFVFSRHVENKLLEIEKAETFSQKSVAAE
ncbi:MAG: adenosyl-hopene transferase HpnH [Hyphomicrobium sp.]